MRGGSAVLLSLLPHSALMHREAEEFNNKNPMIKIHGIFIIEKGDYLLRLRLFLGHLKGTDAVPDLS